MVSLAVVGSSITARLNAANKVIRVAELVHGLNLIITAYNLNTGPDINTLYI